MSVSGRLDVGRLCVCVCGRPLLTSPPATLSRCACMHSSDSKSLEIPYMHAYHGMNTHGRSTHEGALFFLTGGRRAIAPAAARAPGEARARSVDHDGRMVARTMRRHARLRPQRQREGKCRARQEPGRWIIQLLFHVPRSRSCSCGRASI